MSSLHLKIIELVFKRPLKKSDFLIGGLVYLKTNFKYNAYQLTILVCYLLI